MTLIIVQTIFQSVLSTLSWLGFFSGIRALNGPEARKWLWTFGSAILAFAWLLGIFILGSENVFGTGGAAPGIPLALVGTLLFGYLLLLSRDFRTIISSIPPHWLIAIQTSRIIGAVFLIRWWQGGLPAEFAIPAGVGDILTGLSAPLVAYWLYTGKPYARTAAILWNLFGMADFVSAVTLANIVHPGNVFPVVMIPVYGVPRGFLIHSYSLIGLLKGTARQRSFTNAAEIAARA
jgi:hypothetical protein